MTAAVIEEQKTSHSAPLSALVLTAVGKGAYSRSCRCCTHQHHRPVITACGLFGAALIYWGDYPSDFGVIID